MKARKESGLCCQVELAGGLEKVGQLEISFNKLKKKHSSTVFKKNLINDFRGTLNSLKLAKNG